MSSAGGPIALYEKALKQPDFQADPAQREAALALQNCFEELTRPLTDKRGFFSRLFGRRTQSYDSTTKGLYLWGTVGRGKTWLMDLFYDSLPFKEKTRLHFHRFMQRIHEELRSRPQEQNPLDDIAAQWAQRTRVLCFDEFFVSDIADAMLLAGLLDGLFQRGVMLVTTSNVQPDDLFKDGLQRQKFIPAIDLIKAHCRVQQLGGDTDYRLRILEAARIYHSPLSKEATAHMDDAFCRIAPGSIESDAVIGINGRSLKATKRADGIIWFDFTELCGQPTGANDYIELARSFNTVLISDIPQLSELENDQARRLITLVDEFYDRNVKLIISAAVEVDELYQGERLQFEFSRTRSRLIEMRSHDYLAREHLA